MKRSGMFKLAAAATAIAALALTAGSALAQQAFTIQIDGSSTVFPISEAVAEAFQRFNFGAIPSKSVTHIRLDA